MNKVLAALVVLLSLVVCAQESSRDELLDPRGSWRDTYKHSHITARPVQFKKWHELFPDMRTYCVGFTAKGCDETYPDDRLWTETIVKRVDPACLEVMKTRYWWGEDCGGNFIRYSETEDVKPIWIKGEKRKTSVPYTANGHWECPEKFETSNFGGSVTYMNGMPQGPTIYYIPPKPYCSRAFFWGVWRPSPYRADKETGRTK